MIDFQGKTVFITGAGSGIGRTTALTLSSLGAHVGILDIDLEAARSTVDEAGCPGSAHALRCDVADRVQVHEVIEQLIHVLGVPHAVVNNAGVAPTGPVDAITSDDLQRTMAVNVGGPINVVGSLRPHFRANGGGRIVNVASWLGMRSRAMFGLYSASKAALVSLTRTMALELASDSIAVNAVMPGVIAGTAMRQETDAAARAASLPTSSDRAGTIPLGRLGTPQDVANVIVFMCSEAASYMTGDSVGIDGGIGAAAV
jgi:NAD(P)-dependent dehydrogenase (short-subunit alcohol dehydrogenase family)